MEVTICVGISGSGKTTFTTSYLKSHRFALRCNRDAIRDVLTVNGSTTSSYYKRADLFSVEELVTKIQDSILQEAVMLEKDLVVDNTNLTKEHIAHVLFELGDLDIKHIKFKLFDCDPTLAKKRVMERNNFTEEQVAYIDKQYKQYEQVKKWLLETYPKNIL